LYVESPKGVGETVTTLPRNFSKKSNTARNLLSTLFGDILYEKKVESYIDTLIHYTLTDNKNNKYLIMIIS